MRWSISAETLSWIVHRILSREFQDVSFSVIFVTLLQTAHPSPHSWLVITTAASTNSASMSLANKNYGSSCFAYVLWQTFADWQGQRPLLTDCGRPWTTILVNACNRYRDNFFQKRDMQCCHRLWSHYHILCRTLWKPLTRAVFQLLLHLLQLHELHSDDLSEAMRYERTPQNGNAKAKICSVFLLGHSITNINHCVPLMRNSIPHVLRGAI